MLGSIRLQAAKLARGVTTCPVPLDLLWASQTRGSFEQSKAANNCLSQVSLLVPGAGAWLG